MIYIFYCGHLSTVQTLVHASTVEICSVKCVWTFQMSHVAEVYFRSEDYSYINQASLVGVGIFLLYSYQPQQQAADRWTCRDGGCEATEEVVWWPSLRTLKCINGHMQAQIKNRVLAWMFTLVPLPFLRGFVGMGGPVGEREMRFFNTPLPFSFSPTPPHTWDGHFISEYSKWKGDLNLPCLPVTPFLSPSPTHSFRCWWTERCWLPIADTKVLYSEKHFFSPPNSLFCFIEVFFEWLAASGNTIWQCISASSVLYAVWFH